jgi:Na+/melibiose symporter-like transporter
MMMGVTAFLPPYIQGVMGRSALTAGIGLAAMSVGWSVASPIAGRVMGHTSYRATSIAGALLMLAGSALLATMRPASGPVWAATASGLMGAGLGFAISTFTVAAQGAVGWQDRGVATSSTVFTRIVGQAIGTALLGAVLNLGLEHRLPGMSDALDRLMVRAHLGGTAPGPLVDAAAESLHGVYVAVALLALLGLLGTLALPAGHRPGRQPQP